MANLRVDQFAVAPALTSADIFPVVPQPGIVAMQTTLGDIRNLFGTTLFVDTTIDGTTAVVTPEILKTYIMPANTVNTDGSYLEITALFANAGNVNSKTAEIKVNGITISTSISTVSSNVIILKALFIRQSATAYQHMGSSIDNVGARTVGFGNGSGIFFNAPITITVVGTNGVASAGDINSYGFIVQAFNI